MLQLGICSIIIYSLLEIVITILFYNYLKKADQESVNKLFIAMTDRIFGCFLLNVVLCIPLIYIIITIA